MSEKMDQSLTLSKIEQKVRNYMFCSINISSFQPAHLIQNFVNFLKGYKVLFISTRQPPFNEKNIVCNVNIICNHIYWQSLEAAPNTHPITDIQGRFVTVSGLTFLSESFSFFFFLSRSVS